MILVQCLKTKTDAKPPLSFRIFKIKIMTTDEMLIEIVNYKYKSASFPCVFLDYSQSLKCWNITWRNPIDFSNEKQTQGKTPNEACKKALKFIKSNPSIFSRSNKAGV